MTLQHLADIRIQVSDIIQDYPDRARRLQAALDRARLDYAQSDVERAQRCFSCAFCIEYVPTDTLEHALAAIQAMGVSRLDLHVYACHFAVAAAKAKWVATLCASDSPLHRDFTTYAHDSELVVSFFSGLADIW